MTSNQPYERRAHGLEVHEELDIGRIVSDPGGLRISIFAPMQRAAAGAEANAIRFKALAQRARLELGRTGASTRTMRAIEQGLQGIVDDPAFWQQQLDGLAVFASPSERFAYKLPLELREHAYVSEHYQVLPLLPLLDDERALVLALSQERVRWFESDRLSTQEMRLPDEVPRSLTQVAGDEVEEQHLQLHASRPGGAIYHGQGGGKDDRLPELERFCRAIANGIKTPLKTRTASLVLAGDRPLIALFQRIAALPDDVDLISGNFDGIAAPDLHAKVLPIIERRGERRARRAVERFRAAQARDRTTYKPDAIARAAAEGTVAELLIGDVDHETAKSPAATRPVTPSDTFRNDAALATLRHGGAVHALPHASMPDQRYIAAILRY